MYQHQYWHRVLVLKYRLLTRGIGIEVLVSVLNSIGSRYWYGPNIGIGEVLVSYRSIGIKKSFSFFRMYSIMTKF
jgi:hypothetical protein